MQQQFFADACSINCYQLLCQFMVKHKKMFATNRTRQQSTALNNWASMYTAKTHYNRRKGRLAHQDAFYTSSHHSPVT